MSTYIAFLDSNNLVTQILQSPDNGQDWVSIWSGKFGCTCVETKKDGSVRGKYAQVGDTYYPDIDAFLEPKPYESWGLNESEKKWEAPVAMPEDELGYEWDEDSRSWIVIYDPADPAFGDPFPAD